MKRTAVAAIAFVAVAVTGHYFGARFGVRVHPAGRSGPAARRTITDASGAPLPSLFAGPPNSTRGRGSPAAAALTSGCQARPGFFARMAARVGLEVPVYAQSNCVNTGICYGCPTESKPGGVDLEYGTCNWPCTGSVGFSVVIPDEGSPRGYMFTGLQGCNQLSGCPCTFSYCYDCTPSS